MDFPELPPGFERSNPNGSEEADSDKRKNKKPKTSSEEDHMNKLYGIFKQSPYPKQIKVLSTGEAEVDKNQVHHWYNDEFKEAIKQAFNMFLATRESKRRNPTKGSLGNKNDKEIMIPVQKSLATTNHNVPVVSDRVIIDVDADQNQNADDIFLPTNVRNCSDITRAPEKRVQDDVTRLPQNFVAYDDDTHFLGGDIRCEGIRDFFWSMDDTPILGENITIPVPGSGSGSARGSVKSGPAAVGKGIGDARDVSDCCLPRAKLQITDMEKKEIMETVTNAMEEVTRLLKVYEPFWVRILDSGQFILRRDIYDEMYHKKSVLGGCARYETSKDQQIVSMAGAQLVDMLLDSEKWVKHFPTIVGNAQTIGVLEDGSLESRDGALQLMNAKMRILSPLVPARNTSFFRYCKQLEKGLWVIADVSMSLNSIKLKSNPPNAWKFPSGCMIEEISNNSCRVSWVEHIQVDDITKIADPTFRKIICANNAYRAERWILTLERMCQRFLNSSIVNIRSNAATEMNPTEGKSIVMKLGERMLKIFYDALDMSSNKDFPALNKLDSNGVRVNVRKCRDPGTEKGAIATASASFWLSCSPEFAFNFLKDNSRRFQWDVICEDIYPVEELNRITYGTNHGNFTSIIRTLNIEDMDVRILQECYSHEMESRLVYCTIDTETMNCALSGEDCSRLPLLPSGFTISGDGQSSGGNKRAEAGRWSEGSVVTVAYQLRVARLHEIDNPNLNAVKKMNRIVTSTVNKIKHALR